jgi:hypothetical protein
MSAAGDLCRVETVPEPAQRRADIADLITMRGGNPQSRPAIHIGLKAAWPEGSGSMPGTQTWRICVRPGTRLASKKPLVIGEMGMLAC